MNGARFEAFQIYTQGRIVGRCLFTAKYGQLYGRPNYPAGQIIQLIVKMMFGLKSVKNLSNQGSVKCHAPDMVYDSLTVNTTPSLVPSYDAWFINDEVL